MAEDIKELIEKIQEDGIRVAQEKANQIESQARQKADEIIKNAKTEADKIIKAAKDMVAKMENTSLASLKQASRDLLLSLRKEISALLDKVIASAANEALTPNELAKILTVLINQTTKHDKGDIIVLVNKDDLHSLEKGLLAELKDEIKKGVTLKASEDIAGGFIISYDAEKSHFDFTDKALAEYISSYLKPKLTEILK